MSRKLRFRAGKLRPEWWPLWCVLVVNGAGPRAAEVYRWVDKDGRVSYSDRAPAAHPRHEVIPIDEIRNGPATAERQVARLPTDASSAEPYRLMLAGRNPIRISPDRAGLYSVDGTVHGRKAHFLIDTGANVVTLSSKHARELGIAIPEGAKAQFAETASGHARVTDIVLKEVRVGNVAVRDVAAIVTDNDYPQEILLGLSFLSHVHFFWNGRILEIARP